MAIRHTSANFAPNQNTTEHTARGGAKGSSARRRLTRIIRGALATACLGLIVTQSGGCTITSGFCKALDQSDCIDDFMVGYRNRAMAEKAWHCRKDGFGSQMHAKEFKDGFIDGYLEVAAGGPGCCPTLAPSKYWGWEYQSGNGQQAVNAWFAGYPLGVQAAEQDGIGHYQQIRTMNAPIPTGAMQPSDGMNHGVANPFYSEEEIIPVPEMIEMEVEENPPVEMIEIPQPDSVFNISPAYPARFADEPELIARRDVDRDRTPVQAQLRDNPIELNAPGQPLIEDDYLAPSSDLGSGQLQFSFE